MKPLASSKTARLFRLNLQIHTSSVYLILC